MLMVHFPERGTASHHRPLLTAGDTEPNDRLANELSYCSAPSPAGLRSWEQASTYRVRPWMAVYLLEGSRKKNEIYRDLNSLILTMRAETGGRDKIP